jgi:hypothetical protein
MPHSITRDELLEARELLDNHDALLTLNSALKQRGANLRSTLKVSYYNKDAHERTFVEVNLTKAAIAPIIDAALKDTNARLKELQVSTAKKRGRRKA